MKLSCLITFVILNFSAFSQPENVQLASDIWPPFTGQQGQTAVSTDLVKEALRRIGVTANTSILPFQDVLTGLDKGSFDGSAALWKSPEREENLFFSDPYLFNQLVLVGNKGSETAATSFDELTGKKIAIVGSYDYGALQSEHMGVNFVEGQSDQQNLDRLLKGEVDFMLADALLVHYLSEYQQEEVIEHLQIGTNTLLTRSLHFALRKEVEGSDHMIEEFNSEIRKMIADGTYNRILELNWISADVDGDGRMEWVLNNDAGSDLPPTLGYSIAGEKASAESGYYVNGKMYDDWNAVPANYRTRMNTPEDLERVKVLQFNF